MTNVAALIQELRNDDWLVRRRAAKALEDHVESAPYDEQLTPVKAAFLQEVLVHVLRNDADGYIREAAAEALKYHVESAPYDEQLTPVKAAFVRALRNDTRPNIRLKAAEALEGHGNDPAVKRALLIHALRNDNDPDAAEDLREYVNDPAVKAAFVQAYLRVYLNLSEIATEALKDHWNDPGVQELLIYALLRDGDPDVRLKAAEALAPYAVKNSQINGAMVEAFKNDSAKGDLARKVRQIAARVADCSGKDLTSVNFSGLQHLPKVDKNTTVIPPEWCKPKSGLMGIGNAFDKNKANSSDIPATNKRFEGVPPEELERQFLQPHQLSIPQRFGLRMMLQQGQLPHTQRIDTDWDQPAVQFVDAAELLDIPQLLTDSAAVEKYLRDHHIGLATGDHSQHQDRNGGKALPPTFRGALIRDFNGNGRTMPKDLRGTWWNNATAIGAGFQGADLSGATLIGVDLSKANLSGVNLSGARLVNCKINGANLTGAIMDCTWIENCTIADSVMHGGVMRDVIVTASYINNLTLHGMDENPMMIKGLYLSDSVMLDYALMGNCHVQQIEVHGSAVVGQSNGHVPPVELDYCPLSYYADQPPLRGLSNLILPPNGMVVRQINCDRQTGAIGSSLVLTVVDADGQPIDDKLLLEHLAGVQIGYQSPQANRQPPLSRNRQLPPPRQYVSDVLAAHDAAPFRDLVLSAGR